ncbi:LCP family protein [Streptomyces sp. NPDC059816]|uniref:LCP family protein n=1 Tax=Streptomyces sp. NPDC059816 TaxID=3346960 RepID=UPI003662FCAA
MNAHHRGGADEDGFDAADLWVRNPQTGAYELRLDDAQEPPADRGGHSGAPAPDRPLPGQRGRRRRNDTYEEPGAPFGEPDDYGDRYEDERAERGGRGRRGRRNDEGAGVDADDRRYDASDNDADAADDADADADGGRTRVGNRSGGSRSRNRSRSRSAQPSAPGSRGDENAAEASGRRGRKPKKSRKKKVLMWTGGILGVVLVGTSAGAYYLYERLGGNIDTVDIGDAGSGNKKLSGRPLNILVLGTDKRTGKGNAGYGDKGSAGHADTTFLFHVAADRTNATALSIPRDLITDIPDCPTKQPDGSEEVIPGTPGTRFNNSFGQEGRDPGCTMRTVAEITGLELDHFMMVDFNAVKTLTSALNGVEVCLDNPVRDVKAKLNLGAGSHTIEGEDALAFVRSRAATKNGSDLDRIEMQQKFVASVIRKAKSDFLDSPTKMFSLADAMTKNLTVDTGIGTVPKLTALAKELGRIDLKNISFTTVPVIDNPAEKTPITVVLDPNRAPQIFDVLKNDVSLTEVKKKEKAAKSKQDAVLKGPRAKPSEISVDVYNGGELVGAASTTVTWLVDAQGVAGAANKSNAPAKAAKTTLAYTPDQVAQARAVADLMGLPAKALKPRTGPDATSKDPMTLTLGADFKGPGIPIKPSNKPPKGVKKVQGDTKMCAA